MADILGQMASPELADIAGAISYRKAQMDKDEERRNAIVTKKLVGQALSSGLQEGTPMYMLAQENPQAYIGVAKTMGIDPSDGSGIHQMALDAGHISQLMNADNTGQLAAEYMQSEADKRSKMGLNASYLQKGLQHLQENPNTFKNAVTMAANALNPQAPDYEMMKVQNESRRIDQAEKFKSADLSLEQQKLELERQKMLQGNAAKPLAANDIQGIQKDVSALLKDTNDIHRAAKSLESLKDRGTPLAQTASVFAFMKSLDPTSAVRETEQGQVYDAQGAAAGVAAKLNKMIGEGGLTKEGFQDIVDTSKALANSAIDSSQEQINPYLETYGDTLPSDFKQNIASRIPKKFEIGETAKAPALSGQDKQAYDWAKANPNDPRSVQILNKLGVK